MFGVSTTHVACAGRQAADMGRSALGGAPSDLGLCPASRLVPDLRDPHGARRVRRGPRAYHASTAPSHRPGLSVDACRLILLRGLATPPHPPEAGELDR